eukprot:symbB.v1.2.013088.t1/scaffold920.1/size152120/10
MAYRLWCGGLPSWLVHEDVKLWAFGNSGVWPGNVQLVRKWHGETKISAILGYHKQQEAKDVLERLSGVNCQGFRVTLKVSKDSEEKMKAHVNAKEPEEEEKTKPGVAQAVVANEAGNPQERQEQPVVVPAASSSPTKQEASVPAPAEPAMVEAAEQQEVSVPAPAEPAIVEAAEQQEVPVPAPPQTPVVEAAEQQEASVPAPPEPPIVGTEVPVPPQPLVEEKVEEGMQACSPTEPVSPTWSPTEPSSPPPTVLVPDRETAEILDATKELIAVKEEIVEIKKEL